MPRSRCRLRGTAALIYGGFAIVLAAAGACASRRHPEADQPGADVAQAWITTGDRSRLLSREPDLHAEATRVASRTVISISSDTLYQRIVGFGAAMTDASAYLLQRKLGANRDAVMRELFGPEPGIALSFVRVPMGASDFSTRHYTYDDVPAGETDSAMAHFSIAPDRVEKLPALRAARALNPSLTLVASPWSAPAWMKTSGSLMQGMLRPEHYAAFANYLIHFLDAYAAEGVPVDAITLQNEPAFEPGDYPGMRLDPPARAALIGRHLGPRLSARARPAAILDWDHNWDHPESPLAVLADSAARRYVSGVAWHCYGGTVDAQSAVHAAYPAVDVYFTECSGGTWAPSFADNLKWNVGTLLIGTMRHGARGVALWNLALDENAGPHLGGCGNCRGVLTIDSRTGAVTRNVEYYVLAHASRFVRPGARRIASTSGIDGLQTVAFRNADDASTVVIVLNESASPVTFSVRDERRSWRYELPGGAVVTMRWR